MPPGILASRAAVASLRITIIFAALFIVLSVVALIAQRRWLTRVGPVEVSDRVSDLAAEKQLLKEELESAHHVIEAFEGVAVNTHQVIDREQNA